MKTIEIKIYKFEELSEEAKQYAIEKEKNNKEIYLDFFNEYANEEITKAGFSETELEYSLSYSQGDGLNFNAKKYDNLENLFSQILGKGKEKTASILAQNVSFNLKNTNNHYYYAHERYLTLELDSYNRNYFNINNLIEKVREKIVDIYLNLCKELENTGYKEIDFQYSDEYITQELEECEFLENGKIYY